CTISAVVRWGRCSPLPPPRRELVPDFHQRVVGQVQPWPALRQSGTLVGGGQADAPDPVIGCRLDQDPAAGGEQEPSRPGCWRTLASLPVTTMPTRRRALLLRVEAGDPPAQPFRRGRVGCLAAIM